MKVEEKPLNQLLDDLSRIGEAIENLVETRGDISHLNASIEEYNNACALMVKKLVAMLNEHHSELTRRRAAKVEGTQSQLFL